MICRLLPHTIATGVENMALDEALLDAVDAEPSTAILRTYGWAEPTLSLGYFQEVGHVEDQPRWLGVPTVRRPTGGGALWHDREVTYALVVPRSLAIARKASGLYRAVHEAIAAGLRGLGIEATRRGAVESGAGGRRPFLCFADRDPEDVIAGGIKILGSAQRRRPRAVLQHGSLLLGRSARVPELPGLVDVAGAEPGPWADRLRDWIVGGLGLSGQPDGLKADVARLAATKAEAIYGNPEWTRRR